MRKIFFVLIHLLAGCAKQGYKQSDIEGLENTADYVPIESGHSMQEARERIGSGFTDIQGRMNTVESGQTTQNSSIATNTANISTLQGYVNQGV